MCLSRRNAGRRNVGGLLASAGSVLLLLASCEGQRAVSVTVPVVLDHNRMLVDAEIQRQDGSWRPARLWVDTGNPEFFLTEMLAHDLGFGLSARQTAEDGQTLPLAVAAPAGVRIGGLPLDFEGVDSRVMFEPRWLFSTMHNDANLPATVLQRYQVVFDYPHLTLTLAEPGTLPPRGSRVPASVHAETGIVQIDARIDGEDFSFALDNGASYSFASDAWVDEFARRHPDWPRCVGAVGCANIWGWWPGEGAWTVLRLPEIACGPVRLEDVGMVGLPSFFPGGMNIGAWYSRKSARPVDGFLGPNSLKAFRVEIDYAGSAVYFEAGAPVEKHDLDLVGLTLRQEADESYRVVGIAGREDIPLVEGVEPGDALLKVGNLETWGATMGTVVDALRGAPGDVRVLVLEREGRRITLDTRVARVL